MRTDVSSGRTTAPKLAALFALALVSPPRAAAATTALAVPLALEEAAGVARRAFPARASVPLPRGHVRAADAVWLAAPDGRPAAVQARPLERWPDGSLRWLVLDFLADVPAHGRATYTLRAGRPPRDARGPRVRVQALGGARVLDGGVLRAVVPDDGRALLTEIAAGTARLGPVALPRLLVAAAPGGAPLPQPTRVESAGPLRAEVVLSGRYPAGLAYEIRLTVFAGQPFVHLLHTVVNVADESYLPLTSLALHAPGRFTRGMLGIDGRARLLSPLEAAHTLAHTDATPALLDGTPAGQHADGWARGANDDLAATLVARYFWQEYPAALRVGPEAIGLDLFAGGSEPVQLGTGAAKTHELWLALEPAATAREPEALAAALRAPLLARPPAAWTVASRGLPHALAPDGPGARDFLARLESAVAAYRRRVATERWDDGPPVPCAARTRERPRVGLYGVLNFGDWQFPGYRDSSQGCDGWGNLEYDLPEVLGLGWAATGGALFLEELVPAARHYGEVDIIHHSARHPDWVGLNHPHKPSHFAPEARAGTDLGHTWAEGLVTYYRLTGEARALAAARGLADALGRRVARARNPRQFGWPMIALADVYDATGERRYLDAARAYATAGMAAHRPTPAAGDWKMGILGDGLAAVHAATGDESVRRWLLAYGEAYLAEPGRYADPRYALPLGYLAAVSGDARYRAAALAAAARLTLGTWGKPLAAMGRTGFRLLAPLQAVPGQASAPGRRRTSQIEPAPH